MQKEPLKKEQAAAAKQALHTQAEELIAVMQAFGNLLIKETEALRKTDFKTVDTLQAPKKLFAKQYHEKVETLFHRKEELSKLDLKIRERIIKDRTHFNVILEENMRALNAAQNGAKRLVDRILEIAREAVMDEKQTVYTAKGKAGSYKSASNSLSLDRNI